MRNRKKYTAMQKLEQGLAALFVTAGVFLMPVAGFAEAASAAPAAVPEGKKEIAAAPKYVMPQEQVYMDPSQTEAAKQQLEADAYYNRNPQNVAPVADKKVETEKTEAAKPVEVTKPSAEEKAKTEKTETAKPADVVTPSAGEKAADAETPAAIAEEKQQTIKAAEPVKKEEALSAAPAAVPEGKKEIAAAPKYVMPQEQVYMDPSQTEAAKQQLEADAYYNRNPQNALPVADKKAETEKTEAAKPAETVKPSAGEKAETEKTEAAKPVEVTKPSAEEKAKTEKTETAKPAEMVKPSAEEKAKTEKAEAAKPAEMAKPSAGEKAAKETVAPVKPVEKPAEQIKNGSDGKKPIFIRRFGVAQEVSTQQATVAGVLKELEVNMEGRSSYPPPETEITDGMIIHVLGRKSFVSQEEVEIPFQTQFIDDPALAFGTKKLEKEGVKGTDVVIYENVTRAGHEHKIELDRRRVKAPVNEVVRQGVAQSILTPDGYMRYKKVIYGEATAYTWGGGASGMTSVGLWPKRGIVAVDPRVIPYFTKLFIPGYGIAVAGDTGGAIMGTRIDLFMDTLAECFQWGRREVEIYILE